MSLYLKMETGVTHELMPKKQITFYIYIYLSIPVYEISTSNSEGQERTKKQLTTQDYQPLKEL
jgi:hypothetical protein